MAFPSVNADGAHYTAQLARGEDYLDVFAVLGLHAAGDQLNSRALRSHFRRIVMPHVFERNATASTHGPRVPLWVHANKAKEILAGMSEDEFRLFQTAWSGRSQQTWNPWATPGSTEAKVVPGGRFRCEQLW